MSLKSFPAASAVINDDISSNIGLYSSQKVEELLGGLDNIPSYYQTEYNTTKANVKSHNTNDSYNILFLTDLHFSPEGSGYYENDLRPPILNIIKATKRLASEIPVSQCVLGGDYMQLPLPNTKEMGMENLEELNREFNDFMDPFFPVAGNHESNFRGDGQGEGLTSDEVYQTMLKKWVGRNGVKQASTNLFYRFDDETEICHVFVSSFTDSGANTIIRADFSKIISDNTNDYPYIIYNHFGVDGHGEVLSGVKNAIDYIKTTCGKEIITWISGHTHMDWVSVYNDTLVVDILNSGAWGGQTGQDGETYLKTAGTSNESALSVITIVPTIGKLYVTRFGVGVDIECNYNNTSGNIGRIGYVPTTSYTVMQNLTGGVSASNSSATIYSGSSYTNILSVPDNNFTFGAVTVTMGGIDITSTTYNASTHTVYIDAVTGNIVITATATNNYFFTISNGTITQYNQSMESTYEQPANDIIISCDKLYSGICISKNINVSGSGNMSYRLKADSASWTAQDNSCVFAFKMYWLGDNDTIVAQRDFAYHADWNTKYFDILEDGGFTSSVNNLDLSLVQKIKVEFRIITAATTEQLPATLTIRNFTIEDTTSRKTVTNNLSGGVTTNNLAPNVINGSSYSAILSVPDNHYTFGAVTVTMGGTDITSTAYDSTNHTISIASVTGNVVITGTATNDYFITLNDVPQIKQYNSGAPSVFTFDGKTFDMTMTRYNSGVKCDNIPLKTTPLTQKKFRILADVASFTRGGSQKLDGDGDILVLEMLLYDANNEQVKGFPIINGSDPYSSRTVSQIANNGILMSTTNDLSTATKARINMRLINLSGTPEEVPIVLHFENMRIVTES